MSLATEVIDNRGREPLTKKQSKKMTKKRNKDARTSLALKRNALISEINLLDSHIKDILK